MKQTKNKLFIFLLLIACITALMYGSYAAFNTSGNFKRVAVAQTKGMADSLSLRFSSNYLSPYNNENELGICPISVSSEGDATIGITVCNYPQDNPTLTNDNTITYTISLEILDSSYGKVENSYEITMEPASSEFKLEGNKRSVQIHKITIPNKSIQAVSKGYLRVVVRPGTNSSSAVNNKILAANLQIIPATASATVWTGVSGDNDTFENLDAYNYQISGTEQCNLTLTWNKDLVTLGDWSIKALLSTATTDKISEIKEQGSITFSVGGEKQPTSYMLQFYRVGTAQPASFNDLKISLKKQ